VLERGVFVGAIAFDATGKVRMAVYSTAHAPHSKEHARSLTTLLASGHLAYTSGTSTSVQATLTPAGRRVLAGSTRLALTASATFAPAGKLPINVSRRLLLMEPTYQQCERFTQNVLATEYSWHVTRVVGVSCRTSHRVLEALFVPGTLWPANGAFLIGRWHCRSASPPLFGTADVSVSCADGARLIMAGWHIVKEA
jgi:hypothetical protein